MRVAAEEFNTWQGVREYGDAMKITAMLEGRIKYETVKKGLASGIMPEELYLTARKFYNAKIAKLAQDGSFEDVVRQNYAYINRRIDEREGSDSPYDKGMTYALKLALAILNDVAIAGGLNDIRNEKERAAAAASMDK